MLELDRVKKIFTKILCISIGLILLGFVAAEGQNSQQQALFLLRKARQAQERNEPEKAQAIIKQAQKLHPGLEEPVWPTKQQSIRRFDDLKAAARSELLNKFRREPDPDTLWLLEIFLKRNPQDHEIRNALQAHYFVNNDRQNLQRLGYTPQKTDYNYLSLKIAIALLIAALALWQLWLLLREFIERP